MFSIVIPTHNRLSLLMDAVATVINQKYSDWELIVFDNASTEDIFTFINSLSEQRIHYIRSDDFLPVTDSWNQAISYAEGDYVTFLGDDDGLIPDYFEKIDRLINEHSNPDIVYSAIYQFFHPGVAPWEPEGYVSKLQNGFFFENRHAPFKMSKQDAAKAVNGSLNLRRNYTFNIQAFTFSRKILERLSMDGPIFRSPFPDYYLANVVMAKSNSILVNPDPLSIAGVSKASYGYTLFNDKEETGAEILNTDITSDPLYEDVKNILLYGPQYNTSYIMTMAHIVNYLSDDSHPNVNYKRYRKLQINCFIESLKGIRSWFHTKGREMWSKISIREKMWALKYTFLVLLDRNISHYFDKRLKILTERIDAMKIVPYEYIGDGFGYICDKGSYSKTTDIFKAIEEGKFKK